MGSAFDKAGQLVTQIGLYENQTSDSSLTKTVFVVGANRGIGLQLIKTFQERGWKACGSVRPATRDDPSVEVLKTTGAEVFWIDYADETTIVEAARDFGDRPLDCLVNCAGYGVKPDDSWSYTADMILERFRVMALGPFLATKHFKAALEKSEAGKVVNISSAMASLTNNNEEGENIGYRLAKTALNQLTKTLAQEMRRAGSRVSHVAMHPGAIPTKMSEGRGKIDIVQSCNGMVDIVLQMSVENSGEFRNWKGEHVAW